MMPACELIGPAVADSGAIDVPFLITARVVTVTITRVGTNEKYANGWESIFGGSKVATKSSRTKSKGTKGSKSSKVVKKAAKTAVVKPVGKKSAVQKTTAKSAAKKSGAKKSAPR